MVSFINPVMPGHLLPKLLHLPGPVQKLVRCSGWLASLESLSQAYSRVHIYLFNAIRKDPTVTNDTSGSSVSHLPPRICTPTFDAPLTFPEANTSVQMGANQPIPHLRIEEDDAEYLERNASLRGELNDQTDQIQMYATNAQGSPKIRYVVAVE